MVKPQAVLSHVALLVPSVEKAGLLFANLGLEVFPPTLWEGEGTKEIYVGDYTENSALPLLLEPFKEGAYSRALKKRGPGIHHIAIDVLNLEEYLASLNGSGWFLHLNSLQNSREIKTVYLVRPGLPTMIEVQQKDELSTDPAMIEGIELPLTEEHIRMMRALGLHQVNAGPETGVIINNTKIFLKDLI